MTYLIKISIFTLYMGAVYFTIDYMIDLLKIYLAGIAVTPLLCQFGVLTGLNIYISIVVTGYLFKQTISFWK